MAKVWLVSYESHDDNAVLAAFSSESKASACADTCEWQRRPEWRGLPRVGYFNVESFEIDESPDPNVLADYL